MKHKTDYDDAQVTVNCAFYIASPDACKLLDIVPGLVLFQNVRCISVNTISMATLVKVGNFVQILTN